MARHAYVMFVVDTDPIRSANSPAALDPDSPAVVPSELVYAVVTGMDGGPPTRRRPRSLRVFGTSGSCNFEDAVMIYDITRANPDPTRPAPETKSPRLFHGREVTRPAIVPHSPDEPLPGRVEQDWTFWFEEAHAVAPARLRCDVKFALYIRDPQSGAPVLQGYHVFEWTIPADHQP